MIHVKRKAPPTSFSSSTMAEEKKKLKKFFTSPPEKRRQKRFKFFPISTGLEDLKPALFEAFQGKCAFCESIIPQDSYMFLDRFRPRTEAINQDGKVNPDHYWWLSYEWSNIYLVCAACNKLKGNRFPTEQKRAQPEAMGDELLVESPLLLDPCRDFPEQHFLFDENGMVASESKQGRATIEVFGLNRAALVADRATALAELQALWGQVFPPGAKASAKRPTAEFLDSLDHPALPFLGMRRQFLQQWSFDAVAKRPSLQQWFGRFLSYETCLSQATKGTPQVGDNFLKKAFTAYRTFNSEQDQYSVSRKAKIEHYYSKTRLIEHIKIKNFKLIKDLSLSIPFATDRAGSWLVLLGENGTGKSTILQAIALTLMDEQHRRRLNLDASDFVRYNCQNGSVEVYLTGSPEPIVLSFSQKSKQFKSSAKEPRVLLLGYGATRLLPKGKIELRARTMAGGQAAKAENLFNPFIPLNDAEQWLSKLPEEDYDRIARGLKDLLLLRDDERLVREMNGKAQVFVKAPGRKSTLADLSDGYQSVVALTADIMSVMRLRWPTMEAAEGIVLIDEIDSHLHPTWKMQIISRLRRAFPRLQFIVTSHDPLTLRGLQASEVVVMRRDDSGHPMALTELPSPKNLRIDQLLTSEFFGLNSTVDPEVDQLFKEYYELLGKSDRKPEEEQRLTDLKGQLEQQRQFGATRRERLMLEAADRFLAQEKQLAAGPERVQLKEDTRQQIAEMWKTVKPLSE